MTCSTVADCDRLFCDGGGGAGLCSQLSVGVGVSST